MFKPILSGSRQPLPCWAPRWPRRSARPRPRPPARPAPTMHSDCAATPCPTSETRRLAWQEIAPASVQRARLPSRPAALLTDAAATTDIARVTAKRRVLYGRAARLSIAAPSDRRPDTVVASRRIFCAALPVRGLQLISHESVAMEHQRPHLDALARRCIGRRGGVAERAVR